MPTWIFQGNPDEFDLDGYLASRPGQVPWLVTRYAQEIAVGDHVYVWRNQGAQRAVAGVVAQGVVTAAPVVRDEDPGAARFWRTEGPRASAPQMRATMRLVKVATGREVLRRDWCAEDPLLRDLPNLQMQAGTNYKISSEHARRLDALWGRTGRDWTRNESVAGLWAYAETYGQPVSRLPGSPVSHVALSIGRAVSGVYAKVMNFRSLDPRAEGAGMSGVGEADRAVWREFYDPAASALRKGALRDEFSRLWSAAAPKEGAPDARAIAVVVEDEADRLGALSIDELLARYAEQRGRAVGRPTTRVLSTRAYERNPLVIAIARTRAANRCEVPGCAHPSFVTPDGVPYVEVHHIEPLADGGEDTIENVACVCPAHHREVHLGVRAAELTAQLRAARAPTTPLIQ
jgi:HNH endonuclease